MDYDEQKRRRALRVLIAEIGMVLSVVVIVVVTTLIAMGFFISDGGEIVQSGLLQLHSLPTGATVTLDGTTLFARTNLSKMIAEGSHTLQLTREGYDTWEKTIQITSGNVQRIFYPRLFLTEREVEPALELAEPVAKLAFYAPSRSRNYILYAFQGETQWHLVDIRNETIRESVVDVAKILPSSQIGATEKFAGEILEIKWSGDDTKVLVKVRTAEKDAWILVNLADVTKSLNLTQMFSLEWEQIEVMDDAANRLYGLERGNLRRIRTDGAQGSVSQVLLAGVTDLATSGANAMVVQQLETGRRISVYRDGEDGGTVLAEVAQGEPVQVALTNYYDEDYMCYAVGRELTVLYGNLPSYRAEADGMDLEQLQTLKLEYAMVPEELTASPGGEYIVGQRDANLMVLDLETGQLYEYAAPATELRWLDASMLYAVKDQAVVVWDFDGTNQRVVSKALADNQAIVVTANNRWLYYLSSQKIVRERIQN